MSTSLDEIVANFDLLEEWDDRYRYLIELGKGLEPLPEAAHNEANKVRGCASQVWLESQTEAGPGPQTRLSFRGDSDAHIVRGLVALTLAIYSGRTAAEIIATDAFATYEQLGLAAHLTPQRSNGVRSMIERIKSDARAAAAG
ncbi:MAG: SufE family protein [Bosea sp. (in: a-proteobacteria)]|uniref:SufE family protein n=1 Tax=Bosea sp. (in: a-proteobacteria) TaxID=1871050 RepID=UPI002733473C|nr:SufE family protein [Bosea sp. (in: a-proteobacteria)]MDP3255886.1 SufE family protein [Bosea sp. (in: a-proteobacteria)]MDP3320659.1 SufE family protein [Bosea sp. (in: a-proteobacteria)]